MPEARLARTRAAYPHLQSPEVIRLNELIAQWTLDVPREPIMVPTEHSIPLVGVTNNSWIDLELAYIATVEADTHAHASRQ